jgi:ferric-dicitrate binding protein FerR (iron transport regulator)
LTEADQRAAIAALRQRAAEGAITERRLESLTAAVWQSNTPHELYRRTRGLVGERRRKDTRARLRILALYVAIAIALAVLVWLTLMAIHDGAFQTS